MADSQFKWLQVIDRLSTQDKRGHKSTLLSLQHAHMVLLPKASMRVNQSGWMFGLLRWRPWARRSFEMPPSLMARFSHESRTLLTGIVGYAEFLETRSNESMVSFTAKIIRESGQNLTRAANAYFDLESLRRGDVRLTCTRFVWSEFLHQIVKQYQLTATEQNVRLTFACLDEALKKKARTDLERMQQVMTALVQSVVDVVGQGGAVHMTLHRYERGRFWVISLAMTELSGKGPALELFKSFWNSESYVFKLQEGPGVELACAKAMLEFLGGDAWFEHTEKTHVPRLLVKFPGL